MQPDPRSETWLRVPLQIWGGSECTVNRVGDRQFDQLLLTEQYDGAANVKRAATLGIKAMRVPVLWERVMPNRNGVPDWRWSDAQLQACAQHNIVPIVGLLHHGSGPVDTDLLDPEFPFKFARYAKLVAERYPWVKTWTPINEPLTTARFSALYGLWYPHHANDHSFATALIGQTKATALAMRAIRKVIPNAQLLQTEDLGRATSSPRLAHQRDWENERRWFSFDLLCGKVGSKHALRRAIGDPRLLTDIDFLLDEPCVPDVIGINHYVTSNRHLDDRVHAFPDASIGGNGTDRYVDVEAVRVHRLESVGFGVLMEEAWTRYGLPIALSEVQMQCVPEQQLRWLHEAWTAALAARLKGIPALAVTAWGLFGQVDWHCLVTRPDNIYAPGVFDAHHPRAERGALAIMISDLARSGRHEHPAFDMHGWWRDESRHSYFPESCAAIALREAA